MESVEVAIIGGGVVGLAAAVELGSRGIETLVLERDERIPDWHPRMFQLQARTFEIFRRWGLDGAVRDASPLAAEVTDDVIFGASLTSSFIARTSHFDPTGGPAGEVASGDGGFVAQWLTEGVLEKRARELPSVRIERGAEVTAVAQDATGVDVTLGDRVVRAQYAIGADGAGSIVRKAAGITYAGEGEIGQWLYVPFDAPALGDAGLIGLGVLYILFHPQGMIAARWLTPTRWDIQIAGAAPGDLTDDELDARVRAAIGRDDVPFTRGPVAPVRLQEQLADRYRDGRLFVAGNAAHLLPHTGGHNGNMGIGDAADLGWKLAAVLRGWGGDALLDSYEIERRGVAVRTRDTVMGARGSTEETLRRLSGLGYPEGDAPADVALRAEFPPAIAEHSQRAWRANGVTLDQRYTGSPVVVDDGTIVPEWHASELSAVVAPGHRAPHIPEDGGSLHDAFGPGFALLRLEADDPAQSLIDAAAAAGVPLTVVDRPAAGYREAYGTALTLIRPDGHIAWRGDRAPADPTTVIHRITGRTARSPS